MRLPGIEPGFQPWEGRFLPLEHKRRFFSLGSREDREEKEVKLVF